MLGEPHPFVPSSPPPKVSVAMVTFNHEKFIAQAIESVLMQETDFPVELVIGEDCSHDGTRAIVREYAQTHPTIVRPLLHERNVGAHANFEAVLAACRGEYIAVLDGDDYWTARDKLQRQVAFLEDHSECVICCHRTTTVDATEGRAVSEWPPPRFRQRCQGLQELLEENFVAACAAVVRGSELRFSPGTFSGLKMGDWPRWILIARRGRIGYLDEAMASHRIHPGGVWSSMSEKGRISAKSETLEAVLPCLSPSQAKLAIKVLARLHRQARRSQSCSELHEDLERDRRGRVLMTIARTSFRDPMALFDRSYFGLAARALLGQRLRSSLEKLLGR